METPPLQEHSKDSTQEMKELLTNSFDKAWFHAVMFLHTTAVFIIYQVLPFSRQSDINGHLKRKAAQQNVHSLSAVLSLKRRVVGSYALKVAIKRNRQEGLIISVLLTARNDRCPDFILTKFIKSAHVLDFSIGWVLGWFKFLHSPLALRCS